MTDKDRCWDRDMSRGNDEPMNGSSVPRPMNGGAGDLAITGYRSDGRSPSQCTECSPYPGSDALNDDPPNAIYSNCSERQ